ncbi:MAG: hypothetical protein ACKN9T_14685 [Candidatus Methylumidiphilus sp.]
MTPLEHIQTEIASLPKQDFAKLREWIEARDWEDWDRQIAEDSAAGKLDFLKWEAMEAKAAGTLKAL